jgi:peptidoglycan-associated lipoprotein
MRRLSTILPAAALAAIGGFTLILGMTAPAADGADRVTSRVQSAITHGVQTQPRFTPQAPDALGEFVVVPELKPIQFAFDRATVRTADARRIDADAAWLKANPTYPVLVAGYADERGSEQYNLALAQRRAMALRNELVARGVRADRITVATYGEGLPTCRMHSEACWSLNRQALILVRRDGPQRP